MRKLRGSQKGVSSTLNASLLCSCDMQRRFSLEKQRIFVIFSLVALHLISLLYKYDENLKLVTFPIERGTLDATGNDV